MPFSKDFAWGAATSSYQIEGAAYEDGKGLSIWDEFCKEPGRVFRGHTGDVACDHYHRYKEDVRLMAEMGLKAYRFSISWPRILPMGTGEVNPKGVQFYSDLVDELLAHGITPYITLYHWDFPAELQLRGGWLNPDSPAWFGEYAAVVAKALGGRAKHFFTLNEPQIIVGNSVVETSTAPGVKLPDKAVVRMMHNLLLAHGHAVRAIRTHCPDAKIGYVPTSDGPMPQTTDARDVEAAREYYFKAGESVSDLAWLLSWTCDPVALGKYPEDGLPIAEPHLPKGWEKDLDIIGQPLDFMGQNIYTGTPLKAGPDGKAENAGRKQGYAHNALGWAVDPEALYWAPKFLYERYGLPVYITENGMTCHDTISLDGQVHDPNRIDYLHRYLLQLRRAADDGVPVAGYFQWSWMDNFEWAKGYNERFGLIYVDYETQRRIPKDSARWYRDVILSNGETL